MENPGNNLSASNLRDIPLCHHSQKKRANICSVGDINILAFCYSDKITQVDNVLRKALIWAHGSSVSGYSHLAPLHFVHVVHGRSMYYSSYLLYCSQEIKREKWVGPSVPGPKMSYFLQLGATS